jgi:SAM-dependent methyltransferase
MKLVDRVLARIRALLVSRVTLQSLGPDEFVRMAYLVLLKRPADPVGLEGWRRQIDRGNFNTQLIVDALLNSEEYLSNFGANIFHRLHRARQSWIKTVPAFSSILDIGGSSAGRREGALIELGYPHRPERIDILDLPPDRQFWGTPTFDQSEPAQFDWGRVTYFHGSAETVAAIAELQNRQYDCVFLGQAIEHIYPEKLPAVLEWIRKHLAPDGRLVFDTPNRAITRIHSPDAYIHSDHKIEYTPEQMQGVLESAGFRVTRKVGMAHLPGMAQKQIFDAREFPEAPLLHDDVDACYLFAFEAVVDKGYTPLERIS